MTAHSSLLRTRFQTAVEARQAVKVIAGINNFETASVLQVVEAANQTHCAAVDVAADPSLVSAVKAHSTSFVFASSIQPQALVAAVQAGADGVEIGNYDALYEEGLFLTADEVYFLAQDTVKRFQGGVLISVTIPGHLAPDSQLALADRLEALRVDFIQTEGASRMLSAEPQIKVLTTEEKATVSVANTQLLAKAVSTPIMSASGLHAKNVAQAIQAGASVVGIGSAVNKLTALDAQVNQLKAIQTAITAAAATTPESCLVSA